MYVMISASEFRHEAESRVFNDDVLTDLVNGARTQKHTRSDSSNVVVSNGIASHSLKMYSNLDFIKILKYEVKCIKLLVGLYELYMHMKCVMYMFVVYDL